MYYGVGVLSYIIVCNPYSYTQHVNNNTRHKFIGSLLIQMFDIQTADVDIHG